MKGRRDVASVKIMSKQEVFWRQRSKTLWLREGDQNSKFFHATAKNRRTINHIKTLRNKEGVTVEWGAGLENVMTEYFTELFKTSCTDWEPVVACVHRKVSRDQNDMMVADIEDLEVKNALFHMHPDKSPGPDGMTPGFYQNFWHIVGKDIVEIIKRFSATGHIENQLQGTNIVLIPKKKNAKVMTDLRPISLCNVVYKIDLYLCGLWWLKSIWSSGSPPFWN